MKQEIRDYLGVEGDVILWESLYVPELCRRARKIIDFWESEGVNTLGDIPEGESKQQLRELFSALGQDVRF